MDENKEDIYDSDRLMDRHDFVESEITGDVEEEPTYPEDDEDAGKDDEELTQNEND
jgi:hypothetical protein